ncbi:MAG: hypothetical protein IBX55_19985 [Methyloprofundus sp.]|nr:hypothetical protein [Methyloprofundus sp.]
MMKPIIDNLSITSIGIRLNRAGLAALKIGRIQAFIDTSAMAFILRIGGMMLNFLLHLGGVTQMMRFVPHHILLSY